MASYRLPLSVDEMQGIADAASPFDVPALLDLLDRCQNALGAIREEAKGLRCCNAGRDFARYCLGVIGQVMPEGKPAETKR